MKRAKVILAAIGCFAVIGGALAFNAKRLTTPNLYYTYTTTTVGGGTTQICTLHPSFNSTTGLVTITALKFYTTKTSPSVCSTITFNGVTRFVEE